MSTILAAVQSLCADMVAPPLDVTPLRSGDIVTSKAGNRYKLIKARKSNGVFQLQSLSNLQVGHTKWTGRQLEVAGVKRV